VTRGVAGAPPIPTVNPMVALQRRAFGFGGAATTVQLAVAVAGPILAVLLLWGRAHGLAIAAAVLIPTPAFLALLAYWSRSNWAAQDVLGWLDRDAAIQWHESTGTPMPRNSVTAGSWLHSNVEADVPADVWAAALLMAGRTDEARDKIATLPAETPERVHRRLDLEMAVAAAEGAAIDAAPADQAVAGDPTSTPVARAAHIAYHASVAAVSRGGDGLVALEAARSAIGRLPVRLSLQLLAIRFRFAAISALFGAWLLAAVLVGLATSGGVVWF
jgi:hypothetical protein